MPGQKNPQYFLFHTNGSIEVNPGITADDLKRVFRLTVPTEIMLCYVKASEIFKPENKSYQRIILNNTKQVKIDWNDPNMTYVLHSSYNKPEFYESGNENHMARLREQLSAGSMLRGVVLYVIRVTDGKPEVLLVTDIKPILNKD